LRELQHSELDHLLARLRRQLREAAGLGQLKAGVSIELAAHQLVVLIDGLSAERVLYPGRVTPGRQRKMLGVLLDSLRS
jgi:hypothetical protein